jgi:exodeoxyribonuclease-5
MIRLSDHQLSIANDILASTSSRISLAGLAGTGKTTVSHYVYHGWRKAGLNVGVLGPTGKSAMVLRSKGVPATTIHSAIYHYRGTFETDSGETELIFKDNKSGQFCDRLIIDEASMVTEKQRDDIQERDIPSLWVGDPGQLKPVKSRPNNLLTRPDFVLTEIHRQALDNPIIQYAYKVRNGTPLSSRHEGINHVSVNGQGPTHVAGIMLDRKIDRLIVRTNAQRLAVNDSYRTLLGRKEMLVEGDEIICILNNKYQGVVNGEIFTVTQVLDRFETYTTVSAVSKDTGMRYRLSCWNAQFGQAEKIQDVDQCFVLCDYAYAITCHKAQGSSWGHVAVAAKGSGDYEDSREWAYTAVTRAEHTLTIFC